MRRFRYIARSGGTQERGVILAEDRADAIRRLRAAGYPQVRIKPVESTTARLLQRLFSSD